MTKLSKSILKEIVKECIVEIFSESFFRDNQEDNLNKDLVDHGKKIFKENIKRKKRPTVQSAMQNHYDKVSYGSETQGRINEKYEETANKVVNTLTNDPVMSEIFKDTVNTTFQNQSSAESRRGMSVLAGGDDAAKIMDQSDPIEMFSESANKWASLAFAPSIKK